MPKRHLLPRTQDSLPKLSDRTPMPLQPLVQEIQALKEQVHTLTSERDDLEILLESTTEHSDHIEGELHHLNVQLQTQQAELNALFAAMTGAIVVYNQQGDCLRLVDTQCSPSFRNAVGQIGKNLHEILPTGPADQLLTAIARVLTSRQITQVEYQLPDPEGCRWVLVNLSPLTAETVLCVAEDVSDRKRVEEELRRERDRSEKLLLNILPEKVAERLKNQDGAIADHFDQVTILFADIVNFTVLASRLPPLALVNLLNGVFSAFDALAQQYRLEKIKTIGDAYMVAAGLPEARTDHADAIADMALAMQQSIQHFVTDTGEPLQLRIGINSGIVVAGVIGKNKFIYDLWGDTVNIASRMEACGSSGLIQVTEATYLLLQDRYLFEQRGEIAVKGKGKMMTYWLLDRQPAEVLV